MLQACTTKNAEYQALMTEAGALPHVARLAQGAPTQSTDPDSTEAATEGERSCL